VVLRYADDLGYVPISSVRGMPCIIPQAGFEGSKSANFLGGDERHKTSLDFEAERLSHTILTAGETRLPPSTSAPPRPHLRITNSEPNNQEIKSHLRSLSCPFIQLRF
jgi:hypothetical protein